MPEIVDLSKNKVNPELVEMLEKFLDSAKAGELVSLIFVDLYSDGGCGSGWLGVPNRKSLAESYLITNHLANSINLQQYEEK